MYQPSSRTITSIVRNHVTNHLAMNPAKTTPRPAEFVFHYADLSPLGTRRERLFRKLPGMASMPDQYIKVLRPLGSTVQERAHGWNATDNNRLHEWTGVEGEDVAVLGGNMLLPDTATFWVAYFGFTELGSGYRYVYYVGIEAAEKAILRWAKRKFVTLN